MRVLYFLMFLFVSFFVTDSSFLFTVELQSFPFCFAFVSFLFPVPEIVSGFVTGNKDPRLNVRQASRKAQDDKSITSLQEWGSCAI